MQALRLILTPTLIKNNSFLKLIHLKNTPLSTCFGFVTRQKWLVSIRVNLRKALFLIDVGVKIRAGVALKDSPQVDTLAAGSTNPSTSARKPTGSFL